MLDGALSAKSFVKPLIPIANSLNNPFTNCLGRRNYEFSPVPCAKVDNDLLQPRQMDRFLGK
ncbi:hypothetical protein Mapa_006963 [Marchantia paleacea]|nr:hypothetical protein Mapa_006963 [Marchantia paleacea]